MRLSRTGFCLDAEWQLLVTVDPRERPFVSLAGNGRTGSQTSCQSRCEPPARGVPAARCAVWALLRPDIAHDRRVNRPIGGLSLDRDGENCGQDCTARAQFTACHAFPA